MGFGQNVIYIDISLRTLLGLLLGFCLRVD